MNAMVMTRDQLSQSRRDRDRDKPGAEDFTSEEVEEGAVYFRPGIIPTQRQLYYQVYSRISNKSSCYPFPTLSGVGTTCFSSCRDNK
jgi:hypothetical protein